MTPARVAATPKIEAARTIGRFSISEILRALADEGVVEGVGVAPVSVGGFVTFPDGTPLTPDDSAGDSRAVVTVTKGRSEKTVCKTKVDVVVGASVGTPCPPKNASQSAFAALYSSSPPMHSAHLQIQELACILFEYSNVLVRGGGRGGEYS